MESLHDLRATYGADELLRMAPIKVSERYADAEPKISGRLKPGRDYARILFTRGGGCFMDVDSGSLVSGRPPK